MKAVQNVFAFFLYAIVHRNSGMDVAAQIIVPTGAPHAAPSSQSHVTTAPSLSVEDLECGSEQNALDECIQGLELSDVAEACQACMANAIQNAVGDCKVTDVVICAALEDCNCMNCRGKYKSLLRCTIGCKFSCLQVPSFPSTIPSDVPSDSPSDVPSDVPSDTPSDVPSDTPSNVPTAPSSLSPLSPTKIPSSEPTANPSDEPTAEPTQEPSVEPTEEPTEEPSEEPTDEPSEKPTKRPSSKRPVTRKPTKKPSTKKPTKKPVTKKPTKKPSTKKPTHTPTRKPRTRTPTRRPMTRRPTTKRPTRSPSAIPSQFPTYSAAQNCTLQGNQLDTCLLNITDVNAATQCQECVTESVPNPIASCNNLELSICSAIVQCNCEPCVEQLRVFYDCQFFLSDDCRILCDEL